MSLSDHLAWMRDAACRDTDPEAFTAHQFLTPANRLALRICADCPVRTTCRDDYLNGDYPATSVLAGGWWWDAAGKAHPHPDDVPAGVAVTRQRIVAEPRINGLPAARKAITAARAKLASPALTYNAAARRYGSNVRAVSDGVFIARHAPDLLDVVWDGRQTISSAVAEATRRRQAGLVQRVPA